MCVWLLMVNSAGSCAKNGHVSGKDDDVRGSGVSSDQLLIVPMNSMAAYNLFASSEKSLKM